MGGRGLGRGLCVTGDQCYVGLAGDNVATSPADTRTAGPAICHCFRGTKGTGAGGGRGVGAEEEDVL